MRILILGAGKMGSFLADVLSFDHELGIFDTDPQRLRFTYNTVRMSNPAEIADFNPELVINAVTVKYTINAFEMILPYIGKDCIISDIASVKTGLEDFYAKSGYPFASSHPMFGPTFADLRNLNTQSAIVISESSPKGKEFFLNLYNSLNLQVFEYTFEQHDETIAYSLSIPFASTLVFTSVMKYQEAPGTTFKRHMDIAKGLLSEDDYLLTEILFNPYTPEQVKQIRHQLGVLLEIVEKKDSAKMLEFLTQARKNIE